MNMHKMGKILKKIIFVHMGMMFLFVSCLHAVSDNILLLKEIEKYFESIPKIEARFLQMNPNGQDVEGVLYLDRKNKQLRLNYPLKKQYMVARVGFLYLVDEVEKTVDSVDYSYTPVGILLQSDIHFGKNVYVQNVHVEKQIISLTISDQKEGGSGLMVLFLEKKEKNFSLKGWSIQDMQGNVTNVHIQTIKTRSSFDEKLFQKPVLKGS